MVGRVQQAVFRAEHTEVHPADVEMIGTLEESIQRNTMPENTVGQRAVKIKLDPVGKPGFRNRLGEPPVESRPPLHPRRAGPGSHEYVDCTVHIPTSHQEVDVGEGSHRRVQRIQMGNSRAFDHQMFDATGRIERLSHLQQADLQLDAPEQGTVLALHQISLQLLWKLNVTAGSSSQ